MAEEAAGTPRVGDVIECKVIGSPRMVIEPVLPTATSTFHNRFAGAFERLTNGARIILNTIALGRQHLCQCLYRLTAAGAPFPRNGRGQLLLQIYLEALCRATLGCRLSWTVSMRKQQNKML